MHDELQALYQNNTWIIVKLPKDKHVVGSRWLYKIKFNSYGSIDRYKSCLIAQGYTQTFSIDYKETFAPVVKMSIVSVLLLVYVNNRWLICQMDVNNAFLHENLEEEVYIKFPLGHTQSSDLNLVCRHHKSIYRLKQSPWAWHPQLSVVLEGGGFKQSNIDSSLFVNLRLVAKVVVLVYVDDLIIVGNDGNTISHLKATLQQHFPIKYLGSLKYFLRIEMIVSHKGLFLNQCRHILDLLKDAKMMDV